MSATWSTMPQPAMFAGKNRTRRMPSGTHMYAMWAATAATANILLVGTGVVTSVSFFVLVLGLVLLTSLVALISLILSGLTGLVGLVGLIRGASPRHDDRETNGSNDATISRAGNLTRGPPSADGSRFLLFFIPIFTIILKEALMQSTATITQLAEEGASSGSQTAFDAARSKGRARTDREPNPLRSADSRRRAICMYGYPGGAIMPFYDALTSYPTLHHVLVRHEQAAAHAADGYARATGKVGVCVATSGPGATNLVTGLATAYMDSTPIVAITGQVARPFIGRDAFQETDVLGVTQPITKHNFLVKRIEDLADIVHEAFRLARSGRPGPVLIDVPKDVQFS